MNTASSSRRKLLAGAIGNFIELYDFSVFGLTVPIIAIYFFPETDKTTALLSAFAVYAVAFFARPVGGFLFGFLADKFGRVRVLAATVWLMAAGTALMGCLPTYQQIGVAAPILLVAFRFVQGVAYGGETTSGATFVIESATPGRRGLWVGAAYFTCYVAAVFANIVIMLLVWLDKDAYREWVWRVPFLLGGLLGLFGYWIRRGLEEPAEYLEAVKESNVDNVVSAATRSGAKGMMYVLLLMPIPAIGGYFILGFLYSFLVTQLKLDTTVGLMLNSVCIMTYGVSCLASGWLSDRFGRKKIMSVAAAWVALGAYPAVWLATAGSIESALLGCVLIAIGVGGFGGAALTAMLEVFPTTYRATGHAISYQISVAILGGTTPFIAQWLIQVSGSHLAPGVYTAVAGAVALVAVQLVPETKGVRLRTSVEHSPAETEGAVATDFR